MRSSASDSDESERDDSRCSGIRATDPLPEKYGNRREQGSSDQRFRQDEFDLSVPAGPGFFGLLDLQKHSYHRASKAACAANAENAGSA
jgi:hypothetical protein